MWEDVATICIAGVVVSQKRLQSHPLCNWLLVKSKTRSKGFLPVFLLFLPNILFITISFQIRMMGEYGYTTATSLYGGQRPTFNEDGTGMPYNSLLNMSVTLSLSENIHLKGRIGSSKPGYQLRYELQGSVDGPSSCLHR